MLLAKDDYEASGQYIRENLTSWLAEQSLGHPPQVYEIELRERMVRVEEELKNQRDIMKQGFELMDKRFGETLHSLDKRFGEMFHSMDKRFGEILHSMDKRFEQTEKRLEEFRHDTSKRFEELRQDTNKRFEELRQDSNKRFEELRQDMNDRFAHSDKRFEEINARFDQLNLQMKRFMIWSFVFTATLAGVIIGVIKFL